MSEDNLTQEFNILKVVQDYIDVKNNKALCPFHSEKTPSLSINKELGIFKCFGCGEGGNSIKFVSLIDNISYTKALEKLAKRFNKPRLIRDIEKDPEYYIPITTLNKRVAYLFKKILFESNQAQEAREYLQEREISRKTAEKLGIGYAPKTDTYFDKYDLDFDLLKKANLLIERNGKIVPFFKNRIIFPLSKGEEIVGFMGRTLSGNKKVPKYLNSKEEDWFKKKDIIYGWDLNKSHIRQQSKLIVVEGQFDIAQLIERQINIGIGVSGSYFNSYQAYQISKSIKSTLIFCDGDKAGFKFGLNVGYMFLSHGVKVKLVFERKKDPDDLLKEYDNFSQAIKGRTYTYLSFLYSFSKSSDRDKLREAIKRIVAIQDRFTKASMTKELSKLSGVPQEELYNLLNRFSVNPYIFNRPDKPKTPTIEDRLLAAVLVFKRPLVEIENDKFLKSRIPDDLIQKLINPSLISEDLDLINDNSFVELLGIYNKNSEKDKEKLTLDLFNQYKIKLLNQLKNEIKSELKEGNNQKCIEKLNKIDNMIKGLKQ